MRHDHDLTGNDYVSIPCVGRDGSMDGISVLHGGLAGLIEWTGGDDTPLLRPEVRVNGESVDLAGATWRRHDRWLPHFTLRLADGSDLTGVVCAPVGYPAARGFLLRIEYENRGRAPATVEVELRIHWARTRHWIASARPFGRSNRIGVEADGTITLESDAGQGPALAIAGAFTGRATAADGANGEPLDAWAVVKFDVASKMRRGTAICVGAGRERDGAIAAARQLQRTPPETWLRQTRLELSYALRSGQTNRWSEALNRNLVFNRYFAAGRGIDDDRLHLVRSRSTRCPEPGLFNDREALFWTLPALMLADPAFAREALMRTLETFSERSGEHTRYLDGGAFDAGFVLDQFLLYPWVIDRYITATGDTTLLDEPLAMQIVVETDSGAFMRLHPQHVLGGTDLLPSGEPADYPYATMPNALLHAFCNAIDRLPWPPPADDEPQPGPRAANGDDRPRLAGAASEVSAAIWRYCVTDVGGEPILVSSTDLDGNAAVYDDPALSLALLPLFGVCTKDDPVWLGTMEFLRSSRYPLWRDGAVSGIAGRSGEVDRTRDESGTRVQFAALCADLHGNDSADALDRLLRIALPGGAAASVYDAADGSASAPHHAALAGFLAWSLVAVTEPAARPETRRKRRR